MLGDAQTGINGMWPVNIKNVRHLGIFKGSLPDKVTTKKTHGLANTGSSW